MIHRLSYKDQNTLNNALALEYKTASDERRSEIFEIYYAENERFVCSWPRWHREHWAELTQMFATHWHRAFIEYTPVNDKSVFNCYMQVRFKRWASEDYKAYLMKSSGWTSTEWGCDADEKQLRKELWIHPTSSLDKDRLREKLNRVLDDREKIILDKHFYEGQSHSEVMLSDFRIGGKKPTSKGIHIQKNGKTQLISYEYQYVKRNMLEKLAENFVPQDFEMETV